MHYLEFRTKNCIDTTLDINCFNKTIPNVPYTKFLGLVIDDTLTWENHIDHFISRLNPACYAVRAIKAMLSRKTLRMLHFSYVHSVISCGIIFGGNIPNSIKIFRMKEQIMANVKKMDSCQELFKTMKSLHFCSQYIFSFIVYGEQQTFIYKELRSP